MGLDLQYTASPQTYFEGQFKLPSLVNTKCECFFLFFFFGGESTKCEVGRLNPNKRV